MNWQTCTPFFFCKMPPSLLLNCCRNVNRTLRWCGTPRRNQGEMGLSARMGAFPFVFSSTRIAAPRQYRYTALGVRANWQLPPGHAHWDLALLKGQARTDGWQCGGVESAILVCQPVHFLLGGCRYLEFSHGRFRSFWQFALAGALWTAWHGALRGVVARFGKLAPGSETMFRTGIPTARSRRLTTGLLPSLPYSQYSA